MSGSPAASPSMHLSIQPPFDLAASLESGQSHRWRRETTPGRDAGAEWHSGVIYGNLIQIWPNTAGAPGITDGAEFRSAPLGDPGRLMPLMRSYFRLEDDFETIDREIARDPKVSKIIERHRGLRLLRIEPWECLISFICSANSNLPRIHANMESLSESFGQPLGLDGHVRYTFPEPDRLAWAGESALRDLRLGFRAPYVVSAARAVATGELDLERLRGVSYEEAKGALMELPGVGPKIADCVLLHSLDKLNAFPIDVWVRRALQEWYFGGKKVPDSELLQWAHDHFGPYGGYAQLYLFHGRRLEG